MNVLFLVPYHPGSAASQRFRFEQYLGFLKDKDISYKIQSFLDRRAWNHLYKMGFKWQKLLGVIRGFLRRDWQMLSLRSFDIIFIHREAAPIGPPVYEWWISNILNKKIIYDFDDAIWLPNTSKENWFVARFKWHKKVANICSWSSKISTGNKFLGNFAKHYATDPENVVLMPTTIDLNYHKSQAQKPSSGNGSPNSKAVVIGWTGTHSTLPYLNLVSEVMTEVNNKFNIKFIVISNRSQEIQLPIARCVEWRKECEIDDLDQIDIGIMPMPDTEWTQGKCGFKALQFMAMGKPVVASPVGVNTQIIENGINGFIAESVNEWIKKLSRLIEDPLLRTRLGKAGRKTVKEKYSVEANKEKFLSLFEL